MFTAKDMHEKRQALNICHGIDDWIELELYKAFVQYGDPAIVYSSELGSMGWAKVGFIRSLNLRGFDVQFHTSQKDGDYYKITYPPQER